MTDAFLPPGMTPPDFYIAAIGRSGSTMLANWLTVPPDFLVFNEPFFFRPGNSRLLRIQLAGLGMAVDDAEWGERDASPAERFERIMRPRLVGHRWALKEVLACEHRAALRWFAPKRVVISVRNIVDVALSFFEKHRLQDNLDRFSDDWVADHCRSEARGLVALRDTLAASNIPFFVVRYEDFIGSVAFRKRLSTFLDWPGDGMAGTNLEEFGRSFELARHGAHISTQARSRNERALDDIVVGKALSIEKECHAYQQTFGYTE